MSYIPFKLQNLYSELDRLKSSGEDVVADLRAEINNLELEYLKVNVIPEIAKALAEKISGLRCEIDFSLQFNGASKIDYSLFTSSSSVLIRDTLDTNELNTTTIAKEPVQNYTSTGKSLDETKNEIQGNDNTSPVSSTISIKDYSDKAIVVYGDTKPYSDFFKSHGGYFNPRLREVAGWVFSKRREKEIREYLKLSVSAINLTENINISSSKRCLIDTPSKSGFILDYFKRYLQNLGNKHGRAYSPSSINVYSTALKSDYMTDKVKKYFQHGKLWEILNVNDLTLIYEDVLRDTNNKLVSNSYAIALKLYIQFTKERNNEKSTPSTPSEESSIVPPNRYMSEAARSLPYKGKLKKIIMPHFSLSDETPTTMLLTFIERIGVEKVYNLKIPYLGRYLVDTTRHPKYLGQSKYVDGYWVNTCSCTAKKIEQIQSIADKLGMDIKFITE